MYVLYVYIILPFIAHLSFQIFLFFYITAHIHKRYVYMYTYVYIHICIYYMYVLYVYTYAHLSFKKGTDPTQARSRALVLARSTQQEEGKMLFVGAS